MKNTAKIRLRFYARFLPNILEHLLFSAWAYHIFLINSFMMEERFVSSFDLDSQLF